MIRERSVGSALALAWICSACSGGGGSTGGSSGGGGGTSSLEGALVLLGSSPADQAVNVALGASLRLTFDGALAAESLADEETWLEGGNGRNVPGSWSLTDAGRTAIFAPTGGLDPETDYTMHVSGLTCDTDGRLLEVERTVTFRTLDQTAPTVAATSVAEGATGVNRSAPLTVTFSEALDPASVTATSVYLSDVYGTRYTTTKTVAASTLTIQPAVDLPGDRGFVLVALGGTNGVRDRAGNALAQGLTRGFRTIADSRRPQVRSVWPQALTNASPALAPQITFDESVDPNSVEASSVIFTDQYSSIVPFRAEADPTQRILRLVPTTPLVAGHDYTVVLLGGASGATDLSGNPLENSATATFSVGSDGTPPVLVASMPSAGATRVSPNVVASLTFDGALDPATVSTDTITLTRDGNAVAITVALAGSNEKIVVAPATALTLNATYVLRAKGGAYGVRDRAGNPLPSDVAVTFTASNDSTPPSFVVQPAPGSGGVPTGSAVSLVATTALDPASVDSTTVLLQGPGGASVPATLSLVRGDRVIRIVPNQEFASGTTYTLTIRGGEAGVREASGNWLTSDAVSTFRTGYGRDSIVPTVSLTLNRAASARRAGMIVPPSGFTLDVSAVDAFDYALDVGTFAITLSGAGPSPSADAIFALASVDASSLHYRLPADVALAPGTYTVQASVRDLSGNLGTTAPLSFTVESSDAARLPFERTQVVWTRFDLDRDGNGRSDFEDDLLLLGFTTAGDPAGTNARMTALVRDGILARANALFHRSERGAPSGTDAVPLRMTWRRPLGMTHMQIAVGGLDPEGTSRRGYGDESTGTLGRAYFDAKNGRTGDLNIATRPGLGVFPAEMFLFQAKIHIQVYPAYTTTFARRFLSICAAMGGTPAGSHPLDATVLAPNFDYGNAPLGERARYLTIMQAADDWASVIGVILAHEIGHSVGLVAPGASPIGLHGDDSLHDEFAGATDVMASAVGYDALVSLDYAFRDLDLAYLRQRLMLR